MNKKGLLIRMIHVVSSPSPHHQAKDNIDILIMLSNSPLGHASPLSSIIRITTYSGPTVNMGLYLETYTKISP